MRNLLLLFLLSACATPITYQTFNVSAEQKEVDPMCFSNDTVKICYDFWQDGGGVNFTIQNLSEQPVYWQKDKSFLIFNGMAYDFFQNSSVVSSNGLSTAFYLYGNAVALSSNTSLVSAEQSKLMIPPKSARAFSSYKFVSNKFKLPDSTKVYTSQNSPIKYSIYLSYLTENGIQSHVQHSFYVNKISNKLESVNKSSFYSTAAVKDVLGTCADGLCIYKYSNTQCSNCALWHSKYCETHLNTH